MNFDFDLDDKFYYEYPCITREVGTMKEETDRRAVELYQQNNKIALSLSSGLDSQSMLHSFVTQGIPFEAFFMLLPNYNNFEYNNLKVLEKKYGFKAHVIRIDPVEEREDIEDQAQIYDCHPLAILHKKFLQQIPDDYDFLQMVHDPFVYISGTGKYWFVQSYYDMETTKMRIFDGVNRKGKNVMYGNTSEFLLSVIDDDIYKSAIYSHRYYDTNGLQKDGVSLLTVDRYDYYIKPLLYAKYWQDELIYFGKFVGEEEIKYIRNATVDFTRKGIVVDYFKFIKDLKTNSGNVKYYHNMPSFGIF
jgi:hypothetical protein